MTSLGTESETKPCQDCFDSVEVAIMFIGDRKLDFPVLCESCGKKRQEESDRHEAQLREDARRNSFEAICPPLYRETDLKRIYGPFSDAVQNWKYGPQGLLLQGQAGTGKTRAAWWLIKREMMVGRKCHGISCTEFAKLAGEQWHDDSKQRSHAEETMDLCRSTKILFLDDLGKQKMTERAELELYDVLEQRTNSMLPTIITTNATSTQLLSMLSQDRGNPILRRIRDFCDIVVHKKE